MSDPQNDADNRLKLAFGKLFRPAAPPALPSYLANASDNDKQLWELDQRVKVLESRYDTITKVAFRTSAAVIGLAASLVGWDWVTQFLKFLGL
jgi:hypothetical protein